MSTVERSESGEVIRMRHNLDYRFRRVLAEPRTPDKLSAGIKLGLKSFSEVMREYAELRRGKGLEYQPETLGQAFLQFAFERNATFEQIVALALKLGRFHDMDEKLQKSSFSASKGCPWN